MSDERRQDLLSSPGPEVDREPRKGDSHHEQAAVATTTGRLQARFRRVRHDEAALLEVLQTVPRADRFYARMALFQALGGPYGNAGARALELCERVFGAGTMHFPGEPAILERNDQPSPETPPPSRAAGAEPTPVLDPEADFDQQRTETLCELLQRLVSQPPFPTASELLALLDAAESHVAKAALSRLNWTPLPGEGRYGTTYYQALQQAAGATVSDHLTGRRETIERMLLGRHKTGLPPTPPPLPLETRLLHHRGRLAAGQLLGSWDKSATPAVKARLRAEAEERLAEDHPALAVLGQGGGEPLPEALLGRMNRVFGHDFSHVRIHTDARSAEVAQLLGARALAFGTHVYFGAGQYAPGTVAGDRLLIHELMHVVQFDQGRLAGGVPLSHHDDPAEQEARAAETQVATMATDKASPARAPDGEPQSSTALFTSPRSMYGSSVEAAGSHYDARQAASSAPTSAVRILRQEREDPLPEIVVVAHGLDFERQGHDLRVEVYWWWLLRQEGRDHRPLQPHEMPPPIVNPRVHAEHLLRRLEAYTGLRMPPPGRAALLGRGEFPLQRQDGYTYGTVLQEAELVSWFGAEPWQRFLRGETLPGGEGGGPGSDELAREIAGLPRDVQDMMGAEPGLVPEAERGQFLRIVRRLAQMSASDRALFRQMAQRTTDLDLMEASLEAFAQDPERAVIGWFKEQLKAEALRRLDSNLSVMREVEARYRPESSPEMDAHWTRLRQLMDRDRRLYEHEEEAEDTLFSIQMSQGQLIESMANSTLFGIFDVPGFLQQQYDELEAQAQETQARLQEIRQARAVLHRAFPELAAYDPEDVSPNESNPQLYRRLQTTFAEIYENIASVRARVESEDIPLSKLGPVVQEIEAAHGISRERAEQGDRLSVIVLTWLDGEDTEEALITWIGTILGVALAIGAFFATGGLAIVLGLAGAAVNVGTAAYSFERADDLYDAARTSQAGGQALVDDPEAARFNYIMGWVNLVLAGLDLTLATRAGTTFLRGGQIARRLAGSAGAEVLQHLPARWCARRASTSAIRGDRRVRDSPGTRARAIRSVLTDAARPRRSSGR